MRRTILAVLAAALTFFALAAPSAAGGCINESKLTEGAGTDVRISHCAFTPGVLRVPVGTRVTWTNAVDEFLPHVVSGIGWGRTQSMLMPGDTFSHDFTEAGIYPYTCTLHPGMSALVLVGDVAVPSAQPNTIAAKIDTAPQAPAQKGPDGSWLAIALLASIVVGVTSFTVGRSFPRT